MAGKTIPDSSGQIGSLRPWTDYVSGLPSEINARYFSEESPGEEDPGQSTCDWFGVHKNLAFQSRSWEGQGPLGMSLRRVSLRNQEWIAERLRHAVVMLKESVDVDPEKRGGVPVLKGTRVTLAQILAELAENATLGEIAGDLDLDFELMQKLLRGMAIHLDRPFWR